MIKAEENQLTEQEQAEAALNTVQLLYKLNTIAVKCRKSNMGFLAGQKPAITGEKEAPIQASNDPDEWVAIYKVDFPNEENPTPEGETAGTFSWLTNRKYPMRGFAIAETVHTLTIFKRMFRVTLEKLVKYPVRTALMALFFKPVVEKVILGAFEGFAAGMEKHLFKDERYCQSVREIRRVFKKLMVADGFATYDQMPKPTNRAEKLANIARYEGFRPHMSIMEAVSAMLEFDDAYRYRVQWLFDNGFTSEMIAKRPVRTIYQMFDMLLERESDTRLRSQWKAFRIASLALVFNRPLRGYIKRFFRELDSNELKLSVEDKYHAISKASFDFGLPPRESYN
jgi:hypothetical protein